MVPCWSLFPFPSAVLANMQQQKRQVQWAREQGSGSKATFQHFKLCACSLKPPYPHSGKRRMRLGNSMGNSMVPQISQRRLTHHDFRIGCPNRHIWGELGVQFLFVPLNYTHKIWIRAVLFRLFPKTVLTYLQTGRFSVINLYSTYFSQETCRLTWRTPPLDHVMAMLYW